MKVFVCTEADRWEDGNPKEVKKVFASRKDAIQWVADGEYTIVGKYKNNHRDFEEMEVE